MKGKIVQDENYYIEFETTDYNYILDSIEGDILRFRWFISRPTWYRFVRNYQSGCFHQLKEIKISDNYYYTDEEAEITLSVKSLDVDAEFSCINVEVKLK